MADLVRSQKVAHDLIARWGHSAGSALVRAGTERPVMAGRQEYKPAQTQLIEEGAERFFISGLSCETAPDADLDLFRFTDKGSNVRKEYRIRNKPTGPRPNGIVMFYDCNMIWVRDL